MAEWYAAPTGTAGGNGSISSPWDIVTAFNHPASVQPGDTIWLRGGTYSIPASSLTSTLTGNSSARISVRSYTNEWAVLDKRATSVFHHYNFQGAYTDYRDFEITNTENRPRRSAFIGGGTSHTDAARGGINVDGDEIRMINLRIHDLDHVGWWMPASGGEFYGCLIYSIGYIDVNNAGFSNAMYTQNNPGVAKVYKENMMFSNFGNGVSAYGSGSNQTSSMHFTGNVIFQSGTAQGSEYPSGRQDFLVGSSQPSSDIQLVKNYTYQSGADAVSIGYVFGSPTNGDVTLTDNYFYTGVVDIPVSWSMITASGNICDNLIGAGAPGAGFTEITKAAQSGTKIDVRPNAYEAGRGHVIIYNWGNLSSVSVNLSTILQTNAAYAVYHVYSLASPVLQGTYAGGSVSIPLADRQPPTPLGNLSGIGTPITLPKQFSAFLVVTTAAPPPPPPPPPPTTKDRLTNIAFRHNTFLDPNQADQSGGDSATFYSEGTVNPAILVVNLIVEDNVMHHLDEGFSGAPKGANEFGTSALNGYVSGYSFTSNVLGGGNMTHNASNNYPAGNAHENDTTFQANFENYAANDFRLKATSPHKGAALDGTDRGADVTGVTAATLHCIDGDWT